MQIKKLPSTSLASERIEDQVKANPNEEEDFNKRDILSIAGGKLAAQRAHTHPCTHIHTHTHPCTHMCACVRAHNLSFQLNCR